MKFLLNRWLLIFLLLLSLPALACNLPFGEPEPTPRPTRDRDRDDEEEEEDVEEATPETETEADVVEEATPEPTSEPTSEVVEDNGETAVSDEDEDSGGLLNGLFAESIAVKDTVQQFDSLQSYQLQFDFSSTVNEMTQSVQATILVSVEPAESQTTIVMSGVEGLEEIMSMDMTQLDGVSYVNMAGFGCVSSSDEEIGSDTFAEALNPNEYLGNIGEANLVGEETINGVETLHYTFDETAFEEEAAQFNWAQGDVYIAKDGNYLVRLHLEGEGSAADLGLGLDETDSDSKEPLIGLILVDMNLTNINEPVDITIPAECDNANGEQTSFPVLEDAADLSSFGDFATYSTETPFAEIVTFYEDSFESEGWIYQEGESFVLDGETALLYFAQGDRTITVTVTRDSEATEIDTFLVLIFEE